MAEEKKPAVRIRMYRQGLGDCYLVTFSPDDEKPVHMLIDCGTLGTENGEPMDEVINDIKETTGRKIHILVVTHEHQDHVSGFNAKMFGDFTVDNVWLAWTEDNNNTENLVIKEDQNKLKFALMLTVQTLQNNTSRDEKEKQALKDVAFSVRELLDFSVPPNMDDNMLGAAETEPEKIGFGFATTIDAAMDYASFKLAKKGPKYLTPGDVIEDKNLVEGWRFYVLGPPQNKSLLNRDDDKEGSLYGFSNQLAADLSANALFFGSNLPAGEYRAGLPDFDARQQFDIGLPFDPIFRIDKDTQVTAHEAADQQEGKEDTLYERLAAKYEQESWRCIDYDWLGSAEDFALQLDNAINNTSLVLAMEHIADGRVLLFPGDAQLGNWQSWDGSLDESEMAQKDPNEKFKTYAVKEFRTEGETVVKSRFRTKDGIIVGSNDETPVTTTNLLNRTVFYKVGHHSSHNATTKKGLGKMVCKDLVAMTSLDSVVAQSRHPGWNFPNPELYKALLTATKGRVLRSDLGWPHPIEHTPEFREVSKPKLKNDATVKEYDEKRLVRDELNNQLKELEKNKKPNLNVRNALIKKWKELEKNGKMEQLSKDPESKKEFFDDLFAWYDKWEKWKENGEVGKEIKNAKHELPTINKGAKKLVYLDPEGKFRIEYEFVDKKPPEQTPEIPEPGGKYIDYIMY